MKEACHKSLHTVWLNLYDILGTPVCEERNCVGGCPGWLVREESWQQVNMKKLLGVMEIFNILMIMVVIDQTMYF